MFFFLLLKRRFDVAARASISSATAGTDNCLAAVNTRIHHFPHQPGTRDQASSRLLLDPGGGYDSSRSGARAANSGYEISSNIEQQHFGFFSSGFNLLQLDHQREALQPSTKPLLLIA